MRSSASLWPGAVLLSLGCAAVTLNTQAQPQPLPTQEAVMRPERMPADNGPAPPGYVLESSPNAPLAVTGAATLAVNYALTIFTATAITNCRGDDCASVWRHGGGTVFLPVLGPFIAPAMTTPSLDPEQGLLLGLIGAGQVAGLGMVVAGFAMQRHEFVRSDEAHWQLTPILAPGHAGMQMSATF